MGHNYRIGHDRHADKDFWSTGVKIKLFEHKLCNTNVKVISIWFKYVMYALCLCRYREIDESHRLIQWLWQTLESFTNPERILFLRFVCGRSRLPVNITDIGQRLQIIRVDKVMTAYLLIVI